MPAGADTGGAAGAAGAAGGAGEAAWQAAWEATVRVSELHAEIDLGPGRTHVRMDATRFGSLAAAEQSRRVVQTTLLELLVCL